MPKGSGATSNRFRATPGSSWANFRSRAWTASMDFHPPSPLSRRPQAKARDRPSVPSRKFTTTCGCSSPGWASPIVRTVSRLSGRRPPMRSLTESWRCPKAGNTTYWRQSNGVDRRNLTRCWPRFGGLVIPAYESTADRMPSTNHRRSTIAASTRSRLSSTVSSFGPANGRVSPTPSSRR